MRDGAFIALAAAAATTAGAQPPPPPAPPPPPPPPPFRVVQGAPPAEPMIVRFRADAPRCAGAEERPVLLEEPFPTAAVPNASFQSRADRMRLRFRIDASGRPLGIAADPLSAEPRVDVSDVVPAFAAWRFAPGRERTACEVVFRIVAEPVSRAGRHTLYRLLAMRGAARRYLPREIVAAAVARLTPEGSNCRPVPARHVQAFPRPARTPLAPGTFAYTFLSYDIDAEGRPANVRLVSSSGDERLEAESLRAFGQFRYAPGVRTGCNYYFFRRGGLYEAPPAPEEEAYRAPGGTCPKGEARWAHMPSLVFPVNYRRRGLEGWAVVRFDVAPDGTTGSVEAVDFAPSSDFGMAAARIIRQARKAADGRAYTGCTERVLFRVPSGD